MRGKIILIFGGIVLIIGLLTFALMRVAIGDLVANPDQARDDAARSGAAANAEFQLEALSFQRWLDQQSNDPVTHEPFLRNSAAARSEQATAQADRLFGAASSVFKATPPTLVAFVDERGIALGRNGSNLLRGDNLGAAYPSLLNSLKTGVTGSEVWVNRIRNEQMLMSFGPVRDANNKVIGALLLGTPLDDGALTRISEMTSGRPLLIVVPQNNGMDAVAKSNNASTVLVNAVNQGALSKSVTTAFGLSRPQQLQGGPSEYATAGAALAGFGDGKAALLAFSPVAIVENVTGILWPILAVTGLGLVLVTIAGYLLANYISRPIVELETGILSIINGQTGRRFEIEHPEFGGLAFSINSLLNQLMGVQEDDTDEEGRPSRAPSAQKFNEALAVDERPIADGNTVDRSMVAALQAEPQDAYYGRLFSEYIQAKRSVGDPVDHITEQAFVKRIQDSETDMLHKHGKPVRYKVEIRGRDVMLIAVPLG